MKSLRARNHEWFIERIAMLNQTIDTNEGIRSALHSDIEKLQREADELKAKNDSYIAEVELLDRQRVVV